MKIIGHRGAADFGLENSRAGFQAAMELGVDAIEFDVRLTLDDHLVVIHDKTTARVSDTSHVIRKKTLDELQPVNLSNGETVMTLDEALDILGSTPIYIEIKDRGSVHELLLVLERHPDTHPSIVSFIHDDLRAVRQALPQVPVHVLENYAPVAIINSARHMQATGVGLNKWLMNPLTYWLALYYKLDIYLYTVDNPLFVRFLRLIYPRVDVCTDHPERFVSL